MLSELPSQGPNWLALRLKWRLAPNAKVRLKKWKKAAARHHSEEVVVDEEKAEKDELMEDQVDEASEFTASAGAPEFQCTPLEHGLSKLKQMAKLVPPSGKISAAIKCAAESVNEAVEVAKKAFLAIQSAQLLIVPTPRIRICLLMCPSEQFSLSQHLPGLLRLFPGKDVNVYVRPEELARLRLEHGTRQVGGAVLWRGGSSRGAQIHAALRDTALQDHCCAKHMWT